MCRHGSSEISIGASKHTPHRFISSESAITDWSMNEASCVKLSIAVWTSSSGTSYASASSSSDSFKASWMPSLSIFTLMFFYFCDYKSAIDKWDSQFSFSSSSSMLAICFRALLIAPGWFIAADMCDSQSSFLSCDCFYSYFFSDFSYCYRLASNYFSTSSCISCSWILSATSYCLICPTILTARELGSLKESSTENSSPADLTKPSTVSN